MVVNIWTLIPCEDGALCRRINENEKLSVEIGGVETTCKVDGRGSWLVSPRCANFLINFVGFGATAVDTWKWVNEESIRVVWEFLVFKKVKTFRIVARAARVHVFHHSMLVAIHCADGSGFNASVQPPYAMAIHGDSSQHVAEEASLQLAGNTAYEKFRKKPYVYIDAWRNVLYGTPLRTTTWQCRDEISLESPDDYFDSGSFMPRVRLLQHGLDGCNELRHLRCRFPRMQTDDALFFKQFDLDAVLPGYVSFLAASNDPTVIPNAPVKQGMECHASLVLPHTEPKASPALPPDAMEE